MALDEATEHSARMPAMQDAPLITISWLISAARRLAVTETSFDNALLCVSNCLAEADDWAGRGYAQRARRLFQLAEVCALYSGYIELIRLVWAYDIP